MAVPQPGAPCDPSHGDHDAFPVYGERWESKSAELQEAANTDELTGLLNRRGFNDEAHRLLAEPGGGEIAMFMADLDDFKIFNDQYGHRVGDAVLKDFAQQLKGLFGDGAVVARTGGDEFHVLLKPDTTLLAKAREALQGEHAFLCEGKTIRYRASAGYTLHTKADAMLDELVRQSDLALYHGKIVRDGTVQAYNESMEGDLREQLGFTARDLAQLIPAGILICKNGESRRVLFANDRCLDIFGCKSMADLAALSDGDYGNLVPQGEMKRIRGNLFNLTQHGARVCRGPQQRHRPLRRLALRSHLPRLAQLRVREPCGRPRGPCLLSEGYA